VVEGPTSLFFWTFWLNHWFILAVGFVNYNAFFIRPTPSGLPRVIGLTTIVYLAATVVNLLYGTNYCYSGPSLPDHPTPVDWLGTWPWRIFSLWLLVIGAHVFMYFLGRGALHLAPHRRARARERFSDSEAGEGTSSSSRETSHHSRSASRARS
jgi:uncharacterized membrane protein YwaF